MPEIIKDNDTGLLIEVPEKIRKFPLTKNPKKEVTSYISYVNKGKHKELVDQLVNKLGCLIEDSKLRKRFAKEGKREIERGKFSIEQRNKKLKKIYEEILD